MTEQELTIIPLIAEGDSNKQKEELPRGKTLRLLEYSSSDIWVQNFGGSLELWERRPMLDSEFSGRLIAWLLQVSLLLYSSFRRSCITTADKMRLAIPTAKSRYTPVGGTDGPPEKAITKPMISLKNPKINNTQATIVVRVLNMPGIVKPPLKDVV